MYMYLPGCHYLEWTKPCQEILVVDVFYIIVQSSYLYLHCTFRMLFTIIMSYFLLCAKDEYTYML